ncbi:hypothetical protein [Pantoea agglomerans]|uniref:hypothetical protein n=1 Tax=Enterobacter agglomerans TaxID=549 RepID=UPI000E210D06|nr:hypothetical protein [Pantoea agglomerans]
MIAEPDTNTSLTYQAVNQTLTRLIIIARLNNTVIISVKTIHLYFVYIQEKRGEASNIFTPLGSASDLNNFTHLGASFIYNFFP